MKYGFGIIGTGVIAEVHARSIRSIGNAILIGAYDIDPVKTENFSKQFDCRVFYSLDDLLGSPDISVVCICTPSGAHLEPALAAISSGKHCVIEKPLEITLKRCDQIIHAARKKQIIVTGIYPSRFQEHSLELKKAINAGRFGKIVMGDVSIKWFRSQEYYDSAAWRGTWNLDGGGVLMNQGIHSVDLLQWCLGQVESVSAFAGMLGHQNIEVEDTAAAILKFTGGALGVIEGSTAVFPGFFKKIEILGTRGSAILEENNFQVWKFRDESDTDQEIRRKYSGQPSSGGGVSDPKAISDIGHFRQLQDMVDALEEERSPLVDAQEARKAVEIILAIYKSARTRRIVTLPL